MTKNIQISLITLVVLLAIFLFINNTQSKLNSTSIPIFTNDANNISKFLIQAGGGAIELSKIDTMWQISGNDTLQVKSRSIDNLFDKVLLVNRGTIISNNPKKYIKYSVDDSSGIHLAIIDPNGQTINYYVFGQSQSDYARSYVRIDNDPNVYLADQNITYMLQTRPEYWGEKPKEEPILPTPTLQDTLN